MTHLSLLKTGITKLFAGAALLLVLGFSAATMGQVSAAVCGNNMCEAGEDYLSCSDDCPTPEWTRECERRNLLQGCSCSCTKDSPVGSGKYYMCAESDTSLDDSRNLTCNLPYSGGVSGDPENTLKIADFLPVGANGIIKRYTTGPKTGDFDLASTLKEVVKWIFYIIGVIAMFMAIYGTYTYVMAMDQDDEAKKAEEILKNAVIGIAISIAGVVAATIVADIAGFGKNSSFDNYDNRTRTDDDQILDDLFD